MAPADVAVSHQPQGGPHLLQSVVDLAARFPSGRLLLHQHRARGGPVNRLGAGRRDLQPGQPPELVGRHLCAHRPHLVRVRQALAELVSLLLDQSGLALVAGGLALGLGLASGGPPWLTLGERLVIGMVVSVMALTVAGYLLALATGATAGLVLLVALAALGCGVLLLVRHRARIHRELLYMRQEFAPGDLALPAVVVLVAAAMAYLFGRAFELPPGPWLAQ